MTAVAEQIDCWRSQFAGQKPGPGWIERLRQSGFARFSALGFPTAHDEDWRFTNVAPIAATAFEAAPEAVADVDVDALLPCADGIRLLSVNGRLQSATSPLPAALTVTSITEDAQEYLAQFASFEENAFVALNTAFLGDGVCLWIAPEATIDEPIHLVHIAVPGETPAALHPRALIVVGERAQCCIVESFAGTGAYLHNSVTEVVVKAGASVDHCKFQNESRGALHVSMLQAEVGRGARYSSTSISLGGCLVRNNSHATLREGAEATLNGLYLVKGTEHVDNQVVVDHTQPNASSGQLYKGILQGTATAAFNGRILVRKDAVKTDAKQTNRNLLLSPDATVYTKPELQILADDVKCTHGATVGQLDPEAAFYLQTRGIGLDEARRMLTHAFAQDVIGRVKVQSVRSVLERAVVEELYAAGE